MNKRVAILMSGGVDSSTAAYLLKQDGYEVTGVYLKMFQSSKDNFSDPSEKALKICNQFDIPLQILDIQTVFKDKIISYFIESYKNALTPNPCIICNKYIKFGLFMDYAVDNLNADHISSGHYALVEKSENRYLLKKAKDPRKINPMFCIHLNRTFYPELILPLGVYEKSGIKKIASEISGDFDFGKESEDLCFRRRRL